MVDTVHRNVFIVNILVAVKVFVAPSIQIRSNPVGQHNGLMREP